MNDVLAQIDAALEQRCACGCEAPLHPNGPSAWFATQECQHRWAQRRAVDPQQVYQRPDPAQGSIVNDLRRTLRPLTLAREQGWYWCSACTQTGDPEVDEDDGFPWVASRRISPPRYRCPHCRALVPRHLCLTVERSGPEELDEWMRLSVDYDGRRAEHHLSGWYLREVADADELFRQVWVQLQQDVRGDDGGPWTDLGYTDGNGQTFVGHSATAVTAEPVAAGSMLVRDPDGRVRTA